MKKIKLVITEEQYGFIEGIEIGDDGQMKIDVKGVGQKYIDTSLGKSSKNVKFQAREDYIVSIGGLRFFRYIRRVLLRIRVLPIY